MDDTRELERRLRELLEKATPGEWKPVIKRLVMNGQEGPLMSYLLGTRASPDGMKVSLGSERVADHELVAELHNAAPVLLLSLAAQRAEIERLRADVLGLCLRLFLEPHDSHAPETRGILDRWRKATEAAAAGMPLAEAAALGSKP